MDQPIFLLPFLVAIVSIVVFVGLPILGWMLSRYFSHRERIELIRHGYLPPSPREFQAPNLSLRRGISLAFIGLALLIGLAFIGYDNGRFVLGPWLLGGVVPMLAGIAQIIGSLLGGGSLHGMPHEDARGQPAWPPHTSVESEQKDRR
jgi:hypothetical protein